MTGYSRFVVGFGVLAEFRMVALGKGLFKVQGTKGVFGWELMGGFGLQF